jgi:predicted DNA binding CopG/RHH family protein
MRKQYNFEKASKNPYVSLLKKQITIRLDKETIEYFKSLATKHGIPYQNLINLYLSQCAHSHKKLTLKWVA